MQRKTIKLINHTQISSYTHHTFDSPSNQVSHRRTQRDYIQMFKEEPQLLCYSSSFKKPKINRHSYLMRSFWKQGFSGLGEFPRRALPSPLPFGHGREIVCEATAEPLLLCVRRSDEVMSVTPGVIQSGLPLGGACQGLEMDVAVAAHI